MLSHKAVEEYRKIFKKEFGEDISYEEAEQQGTRLLKLFEILIQVDHKVKQEKEKKT